METESIDAMRDRMDWEENNREPHGPLTRLSCAVCGDSTAGRQWWNRDTGYGICEPCAAKWSKRDTPERFEELYGKAGVHHSIQ